ncbi:MAG: tail fiber domain-containing protein [Saprospiraceae bacterium]
MKNPINVLIPFLVFSLITITVTGQLSSKLSPTSLSFEDLGNPFAGAYFNIGAIHIQNGFSYTDITENTVSAGDDLLRSKINTAGLTVEDFALFPASKGNFDRRELSFSTIGGSEGSPDEESWRVGLTDAGTFDPGDQVASAFSLEYHRLLGAVSTDLSFLYANPFIGNLTVGSSSLTGDAQLYVYEGSIQQVGIWPNHVGSSDGTTWGIYAADSGTGIGARFGVHGYANTSTGTKYGIYGDTDGSGTTYGVFANGNLAYTGTFSNVSDRKFKKNITSFTALDRVMKLQPRSFDMKREEFKRMNLAAGRQFGFIAQELQEVFPELVHQQKNVIATEVEQGKLSTEEIDYLGVDYLTLVPILTQAMQEQQKMLEDKEDRISALERDNETMQRQNEALENRLNELEALVRQMGQSNSAQNDPNVGTLSSARLDQNQPNPFSGSTAISYFIPDSVRKAEIRFTDATGRVLRSMIVSERGQGKTILETAQLSQGIYFYSLVLDGELVDTKKMQAMK